MAGGDKYYVVFNGRKPGIYDDWIDCHSQIVRFSGCAYKGYATLERAEYAWQRHCTKMGSSTQNVEDQVHGASSSQAANMHGLFLDVVTDPDPNEFLIEYSSEQMLYHACYTMGLPLPSWSLYDNKDINGSAYVKYAISLSSDAYGNPLVKLGKYSTSHELAREDVSAEMLKTLLESVGKTIKDFNYIALKEMQVFMRQKDQTITNMAMEIQKLTNELRKHQRKG